MAYGQEPQVGDLVGHYRLVELLATGGVGVVFKAYEKTLDRYVAVKFLSAQSAADPEFIQEFFQEARAVAALNHANIIHIYFVGERSGLPFFAMELVEGETLQSLVERRGKFSLPEALKLIRQAAVGLRHAHRNGVVHRDIKPGNLMLTNAGVLKLTDFGLAKNPQHAHAPSKGFIGTPEFTSPEEAQCRMVDHRSDIYSLGVTLYCLLAGRSPFAGKSPEETLQLQITQMPPPVQMFNPTVPIVAQQLLLKMLAKQPEERYQDCDQLIRDIDRLISGKVLVPSPNRRFSPNRQVKPQKQSIALPLILGAFVVAGGIALSRFVVLRSAQKSTQRAPQPVSPRETEAHDLFVRLKTAADADLQAEMFSQALEVYQAWPSNTYVGTKADADILAEQARIRERAHDVWANLKVKGLDLRTLKQYPAALQLYEQGNRDFSAFPEIKQEALRLREATAEEQSIQHRREAKLRELIASFTPLILNLEFETALQEISRLSETQDADLRAGLVPLKTELDLLAILKKNVINRYQSQPAKDTEWILRSGKVQGHIVRADAKEILVQTTLPSGAIAEATIPWTELPPSTATQLFMTYLDSTNPDESLAVGVLLFHYASNRQSRIEDARQTLMSVAVLDPKKKPIVDGYLKRLDESTSKL